MPEESRTEFIQFCDKFRIVTPAAQFCYAKIFDIRIFAFLHILSDFVTIAGKFAFAQKQIFLCESF